MGAQGRLVLVSSEALVGDIAYGRREFARLEHDEYGCVALGFALQVVLEGSGLVGFD